MSLTKIGRLISINSALVSRVWFIILFYLGREGRDNLTSVQSNSRLIPEN